MVKEPKKSDSSTRDSIKHNEQHNTSYQGSMQGSELSAESVLPARSDSNQRTRFLRDLKKVIFSDQGYMKLDCFTLFWLFVGACVFGLTLETIYHAIVFGGFESRAGLVWGPFSPIYGVGAVALTLFLNRYYHSHNLVIFLIAMVVGSVLEYVTSWGMEVFWGAIAWDYTGTFGSIQGRTNFFFGMMWGMLGLVWVRIILPLVKRIFSHINAKSKIAKVVTIIALIFMVVNIVVTCLALAREKERADDIPATTPIQMFCDEFFPDSFLEARFENMTVLGENTPKPPPNNPSTVAGIIPL